jgi:nucleoside-diphosphate-sugar epimerase
MKILITGGAGFIGHNVVRLLEQEQHECLILDTQTDYGFIPKNELDYLINARLTRIQTKVNKVDIRDGEFINAIFKSFTPEVVIHMASFPRQKVVSENPILASDVMTNGLITLLEASKKASVKKFVYISSSMVYGDFDTDVTEDAVCNPIGQYGIMKYMGEKLVEDYSRQGFIEHTIIRPSAVYGEWDVEDRVVSKFMTKAMRGEILKVKGADEVLDFTYVEDTAMGIVLAATNDVANGKIYNITRSDKKQYTLKDAAEIAIKIAGKGSLELAERDLSFPKRGRLDITRAIDDLGYNPQVGVKEGFRRYYNWYNENPTLWKSDSTT